MYEKAEINLKITGEDNFSIAMQSYIKILHQAEKREEVLNQLGTILENKLDELKKIDHVISNVSNFFSQVDQIAGSYDKDKIVESAVKENFFRQLLEEIYILRTWISQLDQKELSSLLWTFPITRKTTAILLFTAQEKKLKQSGLSLAKDVLEFYLMLQRVGFGVNAHSNNKKHWEKSTSKKISVLWIKSVMLKFFFPLLAIEGAIWADSKVWDFLISNLKD